MRRAIAGLIYDRPSAPLGSRMAGPTTPYSVSPAVSDRVRPAACPPVSATALPGQFSRGNDNAPSKLRILVAEDNFANQLIAKTLLLRAGYEVVTVDDGAQAVSLCLCEPFDIILMDIEMPQLTGIEATERIRKSAGPNAATLIIALTAHGSPTERWVYSQSGIDYVLGKPFKIAQMEAFLGRAPAAPSSPFPIEAPGEELLLLDEQTLQPLIDAAGQTGLSIVIKAYWRSAYALLADMQDAQQVWDQARMQKSAHALKGASINIGLPAVAKLAAQLQNVVPDKAPVLLEDLESRMAKSRKALSKRLNEISSD